MKKTQRFAGMFLKISLLVGILLGTHLPAACEESPDYWFKQGQDVVKVANSLKPNDNNAKNVILFIGDGMGISTITAARILDGQRKGGNGEENSLSFEKLPYVALSKTYSVNQQTADSAPTMSAIVTGIKTKDGLLSVNEYVARGKSTTVTGNKVKTILEIAEQAGKSTGVITTARLTHATPAACYAHTAERDWEADADLPSDAVAADFPDIARQLIEFSYGDGLEVAIGGGRGKFIPTTVVDPEDVGKKGVRKDGRNLTDEWLKKYKNSAYVWNSSQFDSIDSAKVDHLLGLFEYDHMEYNYDRAADTGGEPSLSQMTAKAIDILSKNQKGFFLMVEGGRIDHAHHANNAYRALTDTIALSEAVTVALDKTDSRDTLIIVTADHSQVLNMAGFSKRGNPILGKVVEAGRTEPDFTKDLFGLPYTTLSYANGPGYSVKLDIKTEVAKISPNEPKSFPGINVRRTDLSKIDTTDPNYLQEAVLPLSSDTHGGEDVAIFAGGPKAYLFHGVQEENVIFHIMAEALNLKVDSK